MARAGGMRPRPALPALAQRPLRVGYVSADFCQHTVGLFVKDVLLAHDPQRVTVLAYNASAVNDWVTAALRQGCLWREVGTLDDTAGVHTQSEIRTVLEVAQTIALLSTISEREEEQNVVTLSTLHASKGLEWPHVMMIGVVEGLLPFRVDDEAGSGEAEGLLQRIQEERRLMYVGITRAQRSLAVSWTRRRKKGRDIISAQPSRFIKEMALDSATVKEDPREKLKALRAEFAKKAAASAEAKSRL